MRAQDVLIALSAGLLNESKQMGKKRLGCLCAKAVLVDSILLDANRVSGSSL